MALHLQKKRKEEEMKMRKIMCKEKQKIKQGEEFGRFGSCIFLAAFAFLSLRFQKYTLKKKTSATNKNIHDY
jgi:hypothetical protein